MFYIIFILASFLCTCYTRELSYDKLVLIKSPGLMKINVAYNISQIGQENLKQFINRTINCPEGQGRIADLPFCYRVIALDPYDYQCCDNQSNFMGLNLYPFTLNQTEANFLLHNLSQDIKKQAVFLHMPGGSSNDRAFHILQNAEIEEARQFISVAINCPRFAGVITRDSQCYKQIRRGQFSVCCDNSDKIINIKVHSILFEKEEIVALNTTLNDKQYFKSLVLE